MASTDTSAAEIVDVANFAFLVLVAPAHMELCWLSCESFPSCTSFIKEGLVKWRVRGKWSCCCCLVDHTRHLEYSWMSAAVWASIAVLQHRSSKFWEFGKMRRAPAMRLVMLNKLTLALA